MSITVRKYQESDWESVCSVHDLSRPYEVGMFVPIEVIQPMSEVAAEDGFYDGNQFVADLDGNVVGFICVRREELTWLYVHPDYHGKGMGRALFEKVRSILGKNAYVLTALENVNGVKFYQKLGFRISATFPGSCQGYPCTCVRLTMPNSSHENRKPSPCKESLLLAGFGEADWGEACKDEAGIWRWQRTTAQASNEEEDRFG